MAITEIREKLKPFNGKKTTITGVVHKIDGIVKNYQDFNKILLKEIYIGNMYVCDHIHILLSPKKSQDILKGDKLKVQGMISAYTVQKKEKNFNIRCFNYGVKKVIKVEKINEAGVINS